MTRRLLVLLSLTAVLLAVALPAAAQTPDEVASEVADRGYWIDPSLPADEDDISAAVAAAGNAGVRLFVVLLDEDPAGGATTFADAVLDRIGDGTVLVLSDSAEGMVSLDFDRDQIEAALDAGYDAGGGDVGYVNAVIGSLTGTPVGPGNGDGDGEASGGGSKTGLIVLLVVMGGLVLLVIWAVRRQGKAATASRQRSLEEARREIKAQVDAMANTILEITDKVSLSDSREDNTYLEQAGKTYTEASEAYESATDLARLEEISDRLDEARSRRGDIEHRLGCSCSVVVAAPGNQHGEHADGRLGQVVVQRHPDPEARRPLICRFAHGRRHRIRICVGAVL